MSYQDIENTATKSVSQSESRLRGKAMQEPVAWEDSTTELSEKECCLCVQRSKEKLHS